jgi:pimeloyl-ACP methyl ester carboxylesterase
LAAGSYGTIAAQVYMRQHPDHVRAVLLGGVANPGIKQPLPFAKGAQHSLDRLFEDCAADEVCHNAFPNLRKEFAAVLARFDKGPVTAELINPSTRQRQTVKIVRGNFVEQLRFMLYTTPSASFVPLLIHKAFENDYITFEALAIRFNPGRLIARGMYLTVTCSESVPFITEQEILKETKGTFVGDYRVRRHIEACKEWPRGNIPRGFIDPVKSDAPVLIISGDLDASTPHWLGGEVIKHLPNGRRVLIRYSGHQMDGQCIRDISTEFIEKGSAKGLNTTCTEEIRRPPFVTETPKQLSEPSPVE